MHVVQLCSMHYNLLHTLACTMLPLQDWVEMILDHKLTYGKEAIIITTLAGALQLLGCLCQSTGSASNLPLNLLLTVDHVTVLTCKESCAPDFNITGIIFAYTLPRWLT